MQSRKNIILKIALPVNLEGKNPLLVNKEAITVVLDKLHSLKVLLVLLVK